MDKSRQTDPEGSQFQKEPVAVHSVESIGGSDELEVVKGPDQAPGPQFSQEEHRAKATSSLPCSSSGR